MKRILGAIFALVLGCLALAAQPASAGTVHLPPVGSVNSTGQHDERKQPAGSRVTMHADGSYDVVGVAPRRTAADAALAWRDSLHVGTPINTYNYKLIQSGPHVTKVWVYERSWQACFAEVGGLVQNCQDGILVYADGYMACFADCHIGGVLGTQHCMSDGSDSNIATADVAGCYSQVLSSHTGSKAVESDKLCTFAGLGGCSTYTWHVNGYWSGTVTGPYSGVGSV